MEPIPTCPATRATKPPRAVHLAVAVGYLGLLILNGVQLERAAERLEYGPRRDLACAMARPFATLTRALHAHGLRDRVAAWAQKVGLSVRS